MRITMLLILFLNVGLAFAQIYSWRDSSGTMHYSDTPPADADARPVKGIAPSGPDDGGVAARKALSDREADFKKRQTDATEATTKTAQEKKRADEKNANCVQARSNLQGVQSGQIRFTLDANGERVALDGERRDAELVRAQAAVDSWCK